MKLLKITLFASILGSATFSHSLSAIANTRFETIDITTLTNQAARGNYHAQFFLPNACKRRRCYQRRLKSCLLVYPCRRKNIAPAQLNLGIMYLRGEGVRADIATGRAWLEKAANLGIIVPAMLWQ